VVVEYDEFARGFWQKAGEMACQEMWTNPKMRPWVDFQIQQMFMMRLNEASEMQQEARDELAKEKAALDAAQRFYQGSGAQYTGQKEAGT
jgi:hypothetical protein